MRNGYSLVELIVALAIVSVVTGLLARRAIAWLDWIAVEEAAQDVTMALSATRNRAVVSGVRTRLEIESDSLRLSELHEGAWRASGGWLGPAQFGVNVAVSTKQIAFDPLGLGVGPSNTRVELTRGFHSATITTSRLGRVKRW